MRLISDSHDVVLPDPAGGTFSAAGDFDRLLSMDGELPLPDPPHLSALSRVEGYADVEFTGGELAQVAQEAKLLMSLAEPGPELRGLDRLRVLAEFGARTPGAVLLVQGD
jgi:hypothetical protein